MIELVPLGEWALLARFGSEAKAACWARAVERECLVGVLDVVVAYNTAAVYLDPRTAEPDELEQVIRGLSDQEPEPQDAGRLIRIPVLYRGEDLDEVSSRLKMTTEQVVAAHSRAYYHVFALGFLPGFPYCGYLPNELAGLPRRHNPRTRVEAGSVAIVGRQTGIYPQPSPGGWYLLGRTPCKIVDLNSAYFPIRPGDKIRFEPIDEATFDKTQGQDLGALVC